MSEVTAPVSAPSAPTSTPTASKPTASKPTPAASPKGHTSSSFMSKFASGAIDAGGPEESDEDIIARAESLSSEEPESTETVIPEEAPEEVDPDAEPQPEDWSWAQPLKDYQELHGLKLAELVQELAQGRLPDGLLNVLKIKLKDGDQEWEDTIESARRGAMMRRNYSRKTGELATEREAFESERNELAIMLNNWKSDPKALRAGLERLGLPLLDAAKILAEEHRQLAAMSPEARALFEEKRKYETELAQLKAEQDRAKRQQTKSESEKKWQKQVDFATEGAKQLFTSNRIPINKGTWGVFLRYLDTETRANPGVEWNADMVRNAFEATAEEYRELVGQVQGSAIPAQPAAALQKQAAAAPAQQSPARQQVAKAFGGPRVDSGSAPKPKPKGGRTTVADWMKKHAG